MRVALYARVSTQRQAQAQTVEQQIERLTESGSEKVSHGGGRLVRPRRCQSVPR